MGEFVQLCPPDATEEEWRGDLERHCRPVDRKLPPRRSGQHGQGVGRSGAGDGVRLDQHGWVTTNLRDFMELARQASMPCRYPHFSITISRKQRGFRPVGSFDNSPAIHRWGSGDTIHQIRPVGTVERRGLVFGRPYGTFREESKRFRLPAVNCWAIVAASLRDENVGNAEASMPAPVGESVRRPRSSFSASDSGDGLGHVRTLHVCGLRLPPSLLD